MDQAGDREVDARVEEIDRLMAELQKRRRELVDGKAPARAESAAPKSPTPPPPRPVLRETAAPIPRSSGRDENALEEVLDSLNWKSFKKKEGEWTFLRDREGRLVDELQSQGEFVQRLRTQQSVVVGRYSYRASEDRFLNRFFAEG